MVCIACKPYMPDGALHMTSQSLMCARKEIADCMSISQSFSSCACSPKKRVSAAHMFKFSEVVRSEPMPGNKRLLKLAGLSDTGGLGFATGVLDCHTAREQEKYCGTAYIYRAATGDHIRKKALSEGSPCLWIRGMVGEMCV